MKDEWWNEVERIYHAARELQGDERSRFLDSACKADSAIFRQVDAMLRNEEQEKNFLIKPAIHLAPNVVLCEGMQLGPYQVLASIGTGGMGQVYRARDTRLKRDVAIKTLTDEFALDPDRLARFDREATVLAALNHPNIAAIHDVVELDGCRYLVLELVEGMTLAERLSKGSLTVEETLKIGVQIAEALEVAHERGIVHRDLKPANIKVTSEGKVKVLDFGLAKTFHPSDSSTDGLTRTQEGDVLGTPAYMSPEQARGQTIDRRADIWAFGCVVYELLTGHKAFAAETISDTIASVLQNNPDWSLLPANTPADLQRLLRRCLNKDVQKRVQNAGDIRLELEEINLTPSQIRPGPSPRIMQRPKILWLTTTAAIALAAVLVVLGLTPWFSRSRRQQPPGITQRVEFSIPVPDSVRAISGLSVSPNGSRIAYTGANQLWVHDIGTDTTRAIQDIAGPQVNSAFPFWSPDGNFIAYFHGGKLKKIPAEGGIPQEICNVPNGRGGSWNLKDTIIFAQTQNGIFRVPAGGGDPVPLTSPDAKEISHNWPRFLPDGEHYVYYTFGDETVRMASLNPAELTRSVLIPTGSHVESEVYVVSGFMLTASGGTLRAQWVASNPLDAGEPVALAQHIRKPSNIGGNWAFAASPGVLVYSAEEPRRFQFWSVDRLGMQIAPIGPPSLATGPWRLSPDGASIAVNQLSSNNTEDRRIWLLDVLRGRTTPFTSNVQFDSPPVWAPSSDQIVFTNSRRSGKGTLLQDLHLKRLGRDTEQQIGESNEKYKPAQDWSPDGQMLLFSTNMPPNGQHNFWLLDIGSGKATRWFESDSTHGGGRFSPNGQWVTYSSNESGANEVYVRRFPEGDLREQISTAGGMQPRWRQDGRALFYRQGTTLMEVELDVGPAIHGGEPRRLFDLGESNGYAVLPDGKGFLLLRPIDPVPPPTITVVLNWTATLEKR